jgi:hypothetical protein
MMVINNLIVAHVIDQCFPHAIDLCALSNSKFKCRFNASSEALSALCWCRALQVTSKRGVVMR